MGIDQLIRDSIANIIVDHLELVVIAVRQRAKFEGWLKFELANHLQSIGVCQVSCRI